MSSIKTSVQNSLLLSIISQHLIDPLHEQGFKFRKSKIDFSTRNGDLDLNLNLFRPYNFITWNDKKNVVELRIYLKGIATNKNYTKYLKSLYETENVKSKLQIIDKTLIHELTAIEFYTFINGKEPKTEFDANYFISEGGATESSPEYKENEQILIKLLPPNSNYFGELKANCLNLMDVFRLAVNQQHPNVYSILGYEGDFENLKPYLDSHYQNFVHSLLVKKNDRYIEYLQDFIRFAKNIANVNYEMPKY